MGLSGEGLVTKRSCKTAFIVKGCEASKSAPRARPRALRSGARPRGRGGRDTEATGPRMPGHRAAGRAGQGGAGLAPVRAPDPTRLRLKAGSSEGANGVLRAGAATVRGRTSRLGDPQTSPHPSPSRAPAPPLRQGVNQLAPCW